MYGALLKVHRLYNLKDLNGGCLGGKGSIALVCQLKISFMFETQKLMSMAICHTS